MRALDSRTGAGVAVALGAVYLAASLATGHTARSEAPLDLRPAAGETGLDALKAVAAVAAEPATVFVDVRPAEDFARYHVPGSRSDPGATAGRVAELAASHPAVVVVAARDDGAEALVAEARRLAPGKAIHFLKDGARGFYLAFELPVPLFSDAPAPHGYDDALATVRGFLAEPKAETAPAAAEAVASLTRLGYQPTALRGRPAAKAGGVRKKIAGGCG